MPRDATPATAVLLELVRCPETGQRLAPAPAEVIACLETWRQAGTLPLRAAQPQLDLREPIAAGLLREDGRVCYVIQSGIPILLPDHGIAVGAPVPPLR